MKNKQTNMNKIKSLDVFGHSVGFLVNGNDKSQSIFGAIVSLICAALVVAYTVYQFQIMCRYANSTVTYILDDNVFTETELVEYSKDKSRLGFNIAFGIIDFETYQSLEAKEIGKF